MTFRLNTYGMQWLIYQIRANRMQHEHFNKMKIVSARRHRKKNKRKRLHSQKKKRSRGSKSKENNELKFSKPPTWTPSKGNIWEKARLENSKQNYQYVDFNNDVNVWEA